MDVFSVCLNERQGARLRHHMAEFVEFCQKRPNCFSEEAEPAASRPPAPRQRGRVPVAPRPRQRLARSAFWGFTIPTGVQW